ncbi:ribonuclease H-like domain-containing protein [Tanacetum coccineum]
MVTLFRVGTNRPTERLNLHMYLVSPLPKSNRDAFNDPNRQNVMRDEYIALIKNKTWTLVPRPPDTNILRCMCLFRHKYLADGTLSRYKARLVANGSTQLEGVDVDETFSLVVKPGTIQTVLSLAASRHWLIYQLDVKNAFLHASSESLLQQIIRSLHQEFAMTDLGPLNYFMVISVDVETSILILVYKIGKCGNRFLDSTLYRIVLQLFFILYIELVAYLDADWAGCPTTRRSTSGYCVFLGNNLPSWSSKRQPTLSRSSAEAEHRGVANVVAETCWLRNLLRELHTHLSSATLVYYDNVSAVYLSCNPVQHQRTKHIEIDIYFVRDLVAAGQV